MFGVAVSVQCDNLSSTEKINRPKKQWAIIGENYCKYNITSF